MAGRTPSTGRVRRFRQATYEPREIPTPGLADLGAGMLGAWKYWALVAIGLVLIYVSLFMEGPLDEFMFGFLTVVAAVVAARETYVTGRKRAYDNHRAD